MLRSIENIYSFMQCRLLNVWRVYFYFNTLSCLTIFSRGYRGVQNSSGNSKMKKFVKFPPWWGYGYFLELHIHVKLVGFDPSIVSQIGLLEVHLSVLFFVLDKSFARHRQHFSGHATRLAFCLPVYSDHVN